MPLLEAVGLACGYDRPVVSGINLRVEAGETVVLLGPNGSGKSTLLKTLAGLIPPKGGALRIDGDEIRSLNVREVAHRIASVPQDEQAPFAFTIRQVVAMGRLARSGGLFDTLEDARLTEAALRRADCERLADRPANETSGGERQRALIARALAQDAPLFLLDEPSAHLDASHLAWLAVLIRELAAAGKAVIVALHDLSFAAAVADRAVLLAEGGIVLQDRTTRVLESRLLDATFGATFERLRTVDGRLIVVPHLSSLPFV